MVAGTHPPPLQVAATLLLLFCVSTIIFWRMLPLDGVHEALKRFLRSAYNSVSFRRREKHTEADRASPVVSR